MTLGTGVFLAAIVMSLTALFIATKDRWNWKKIILWPIGLLLLAALVIGGMLAYENWKTTNSDITWDKPSLHDSFWGIALGTKPEDVLFRKGKPTAKKDDTWIYAPEHSDSKHQIIFENGGVAVIVFYGDDYRAEKLDGRGLDDSAELIIMFYGEPTRITTREEGAHRLYCYDNYQVFFSLKEGKVVAYGVYKAGTQTLSCARPPRDLLQEKSSAQPEKGSWRDAVKDGAATPPVP